MLSQPAQAQFDTAISTNYRSAPQGFAADLDLGAAVVFWGSAPKGAGKNVSPLYGYLRSDVTLTAAPDYNGCAYQFQLFPLSFLGVSAGQSFADNQADYSAYRCSVHLCQGEFREDFTEGRIAFGFSRFFAAGFFRTSKMVEDNVTTQTTYISPQNGIAVNVQDDTVERIRAIVGYEMNDNWSVLATYIRATADKSEQQSTHYLGGFMYSTKDKDFSASLQGGTFHLDDGVAAASVNKHDQITALFVMKWTPFKSVALF